MPFLVVDSYTFTLVQENTDIHWKFQQYTMVKEYYTRPPIPPPFIIFNHLALFIRFIYRKLKDNNQFTGDDFSKLEYSWPTYILH